MGRFGKLFGGGRRDDRRPPAAPPAAAGGDFDPEALVRELRAEGGLERAKVGEVSVQSSPKEVCRYIFARLMRGTPAAQLRADLAQRGFTGKVADAYITLIQATLFKGR